MQCPQCESTIPDGSRQCPNCNYLLEAPQTNPQAEQHHGDESITVVDSVDIASPEVSPLSQRPENWFTYQRKEHPWRTISGLAVAAVAAFILINFVLTNLLNVPSPLAVFRPATPAATPHPAISTTHSAPATLVVTQATASPIPPTRTPTPQSTATPKQTATPSPSPSPTPIPVALTQFFNNVGASSNNEPNEGNFDGVGSSYSFQALAGVGLTSGVTLTVNDFTFNWPQNISEQPNNISVRGQTIPIRAPTSTQTIGFLGASSEGAATGTGTITYADGSTQSFTLSLSDWALDGGNSTLLPNNMIAKQMAYRNVSNGRQSLTVYVFFVQIAVQSGKGVQSITLPNNVSGGQMHIFAISSL